MRMNFLQLENYNLEYFEKKFKLISRYYGAKIKHFALLRTDDRIRLNQEWVTKRTHLKFGGEPIAIFHE